MSKNRFLRVTSILAPFWRPTCLHFASKIRQKSLRNPILRGIKILIVFGFDFYSILVLFGGPSWGHVGRQDAPKTPQDAAGTRPGHPRRPPRQPKRPQEAPRRLQDRFLVDFWWLFEGFLADCWWIFDRLLVEFSSMLDYIFFHFFCLAFACGLSCNARPPCSRSAGSIIPQN